MKEYVDEQGKPIPGKAPGGATETVGTAWTLMQQEGLASFRAPLDALLRLVENSVVSGSREVSFAEFFKL